MLIREFHPGEELALHEVFHSSVHELAGGCYRADQLAAWAPDMVDEEAWVGKIRALRPFVAEASGRIVAYGDLGQSGYIDHFYVAGWCARRGIGSALMRHIAGAAQQRGVVELTADVSRCAEAFFAQHGFLVVERRTVVVRAVEMAHARMCRKLANSSTDTVQSTSSL
jgi:putative acetyltransferase